MLKDLVNFKPIDLRLNTYVSGATDNGFVLKSGDKEEVVATDSAIVAIGYISQKSLYDEIKLEVPQTYLLGDTNQVQNIMYDIWNAYEVSNFIVIWQ